MDGYNWRVLREGYQTVSQLDGHIQLRGEAEFVQHCWVKLFVSFGFPGMPCAAESL